MFQEQNRQKISTLSYLYLQKYSVDLLLYKNFIWFFHNVLFQFLYKATQYFFLFLIAFHLTFIAVLAKDFLEAKRKELS